MYKFTLFAGRLLFANYLICASIINLMSFIFESLERDGQKIIVGKQAI